MASPPALVESRIGLLWDSASDNTGDRAIGLFMRRAFAAHGLPHCVVSPFQERTTDIPMLVIGGGEILRPAGDPFYDAFRVPGRHILNTVGVVGPVGDRAYLHDYRLVTVRSEADREALGMGEVAPCLSLLYADYRPPVALPVDIPDGAIGVHVHFVSVVHAWEFAEWLRETGVGPIVWLPVTHYLADRELMRVMAARVPGSILLPTMEPDHVFAVIARLRGLVSSSLHGMLFAYAQDVPFIAWRGTKKIEWFLRERGLGDLAFHDFPEVGERLVRLLQSPPSLVGHRRMDEARCRAMLARIIDAAGVALRETPAPLALRPSREALHAMALAAPSSLGRHSAHLYGVHFGRMEEMRQRLAVQGEALATKDRELATKDRELATKDRELATKDRELAVMKQAMARRVWSRGRQLVGALRVGMARLVGTTHRRLGDAPMSATADSPGVDPPHDTHA